MEPNHDRSIIPQPSQELALPLTAQSRILRLMVGDSLSLAKNVVSEIVDVEALVQEAKRIQAGNGMTEQNIRAFNLFRQAALAGHPEAQHWLSICYFKGVGVSEDKSSGNKWLLASAQAGFDFALEKVATKLVLLKAIPADQVPPEFFLQILDENRQAAEEGNPIAQYMIGCFYLDGKGVPKNVDEALLWLTQSADNGCLSAHLALGEYFESIYDFDEAFLHYWEVAKKGEGQAQNFIAKCHHVGCSSHLNVDLQYACAWYQLAENDGYEPARGMAKQIAKSLSPTELETARSLYREFKKKYSGRR